MFRLGFISKQENNSFKNKVKNKIAEAKSSYYKKLFEKNSGNARLTWETLNNLMDRRCSEKLPKGILRNGIEISDDEDDTHPNIDTPSLFRWRHQARLDRQAERDHEWNKLKEGNK